MGEYKDVPQLMMVAAALAIAFPTIFLVILGSFTQGLIVGIGALVIVMTLLLLFEE